MGFSLNPKKAFEQLTRVPGQALDAAESAAGVAKEAFEVAKDAPGVAKEVVEDSFKAAKYLADHPPDLGQIRRTTLALGEAVITGERVRMEGGMPPYERPSATEIAAAAARGEGRQIAQRYIASDAAGTKLHEPVNLVIRGSKADLVKALESQDWRKAPDRTVRNYVEMGGKVLLGTEKDTNGPVSAMHVDGREEVMAFNKNDNYNAGRDHLRVWHKGQDPETGEDLWEIAATRDTAATITVPHPTWEGALPDLKTPKFGHEIDKNVDGERDLVMHDLLASGLVKDWAAVEGQREGLPEKRREDGTVVIGNDQYFTDGKIYEVSL